MSAVVTPFNQNLKETLSKGESDSLQVFLAFLSKKELQSTKFYLGYVIASNNLNKRVHNTYRREEVYEIKENKGNVLISVEFQRKRPATVVLNRVKCMGRGWLET